MNLCINCRFVMNTGLEYFCVRDSILENEAAAKAKPQFSPVDGKPMKFRESLRQDMPALAERTTGNCGPDGKNFEALK